MNKLFHYTSIQTLALILKSRKLRFNRLDSVDDKSESEFVPKPSMATHLFVSCWTLDSKESIPFWKMYAGTNGVRLGIYQNPLSAGKCYSTVEASKYFNYPIINSMGISDKDKMTIHDGIRDFRYYPLDNDIKFYEVIYDELLSVQICKSKCMDSKAIDMQVLATLKSDYWAFQREYRMVIQLNPDLQTNDINPNERNYYDSLTDEQKYMIYFSDKMRDIRCELPYLDIHLSDDFFNDLEITLGPEANESEEIIVKSLLKDYAPNAKLNQSELKGKIRSK